MSRSISADQGESGLQRMRDHIAAGHKIIVAAQSPPAGYSDREIVGQSVMSPAGCMVRILRRASRQEFIDEAPGCDRQKAIDHHAPYYFEIEPA